MATTKEVFDLVSDCGEPDSEYVRTRLGMPDDELEVALAKMSAEEVVQYLKDVYWSSQEADIEQENADVRTHLATETETQSEDAYAKMEALIDRLRK